MPYGLEDFKSSIRFDVWKYLKEKDWELIKWTIFFFFFFFSLDHYAYTPLSFCTMSFFDRIPYDLFYWLIETYLIREAPLVMLFVLSLTCKRFRNAIFRDRSNTLKRIEAFRNTAPSRRTDESNSAMEEVCRFASPDFVRWLMKTFPSLLKPNYSWCTASVQGMCYFHAKISFIHFLFV